MKDLLLRPLLLPIFAGLAMSSPLPPINITELAGHVNITTLVLSETNSTTPLANNGASASSIANTTLGLSKEYSCSYIACPSADQLGHEYCRRVGCDYCMVSLDPEMPWTRYECDGRRIEAGTKGQGEREPWSRA